MARPIESALYQRLMESEFRFVPVGERHIENIYELVNQTYSDLCDDNYFCSENCRGGGKQPEWRHVVRKALDALKRKGVLTNGTTHNYWEILN